MQKILIIDDEIHLRKIYARYLTAEGFQVLEARDGDEALQMLKQAPVDVVLLDLQMPSTFNVQALMAQIRDLSPDTKIIVSSCHDIEFQKSKITDAQDYFNKAEGCQALATKVHKL